MLPSPTHHLLMAGEDVIPIQQPGEPPGPCPSSDGPVVLLLGDHPSRQQELSQTLSGPALGPEQDVLSQPSPSQPIKKIQYFVQQPREMPDGVVQTGHREDLNAQQA